MLSNKRSRRILVTIVGLALAASAAMFPAMAVSQSMCRGANCLTHDRADVRVGSKVSGFAAVSASAGVAVCDLHVRYVVRRRNHRGKLRTVLSRAVDVTLQPNTSIDAAWNYSTSSRRAVKVDFTATNTCNPGPSPNSVGKHIKI